MLCILTPESFFKEEEKLLDKMCRENQDIFIHIRKPKFSENQMSEYLNLLSKNVKKRAVIHSHYDLKSKFKLLGIHYKDCNFKKNNCNKKIKPHSRAIHKLEDLKKEECLKYFFLSPIFNSISKKNCKAKFSEVSLRESLKELKQNVLALGGIKIENISFTKELGFSGIAVLGAVWTTSNPYNAFLKINTEWIKNYS